MLEIKNRYRKAYRVLIYDILDCIQFNSYNTKEHNHHA